MVLALLLEAIFLDTGLTCLLQASSLCDQAFQKVVSLFFL